MASLFSIKKEYKSLCLFSILLCLAWGIFSFQGLSGAVKIWYGNEIFNHGFLILPGVIYFAYLKRGEWLNTSLHSTYVAIPFLLSGIALYVVGYAGDIQLFMHAAAFGLLPVLAWLVLGHRAAWSLIFPFSFILFAIPVGEQLIPWLQEVTADISVYMLQLTGIPLYRSGLYIQIPQGRFLVAEACSGISFFIASMVVGAVYSFLNFRSEKKRVMFFALSMVYPILANAVRVYGIILIGYRTDMKHAVGADHLIYGWFFFAFVLVSLLGIGELIRDKNIDWSYSHLNKLKQPEVKVSKSIVGVAGFSLVAGMAWMAWIDAQQRATAQPAHFVSVPEGFMSVNELTRLDYRPAMRNPSETLVSAKKQANAHPDIVFQAWFSGQASELVSGLHRLYDESAWSLISQQEIILKDGAALRVKLISNPVGQKRWVASWYQVDGRLFIDDTKTKLYQTGQALLGRGEAGLRVIVSVGVQSTHSQADSLQRLTLLAEQLLGEYPKS